MAPDLTFCPIVLICSYHFLRTSYTNKIVVKRKGVFFTKDGGDTPLGRCWQIDLFKYNVLKYKVKYIFLVWGHWHCEWMSFCLWNRRFYHPHPCLSDFGEFLLHASWMPNNISSQIHGLSQRSVDQNWLVKKVHFRNIFLRISKISTQKCIWSDSKKL